MAFEGCKLLVQKGLSNNFQVGPGGVARNQFEFKPRNHFEPVNTKKPVSASTKYSQQEETSLSRFKPRNHL